MFKLLVKNITNFKRIILDLNNLNERDRFVKNGLIKNIKGQSDIGCWLWKSAVSGQLLASRVRSS